MANTDVLVITGGAGGMGLAAAFISGCDIRVDGGLVGAAKHMLGGG